MTGFALLSLAGCGHKAATKTAKPKADKTSLKLVNVKDSEASTNNHGKFTLHIQTDKRAKATISMENSVGDNIGKSYTFKLNYKGQGQTTITLKKSWDTKIYRVSAKSGSKARVSKDFVLDNASTARQQLLDAKAAAKKAKRIAESKKDKAESESESAQVSSEVANQSKSSDTKTSSSKFPKRYHHVSLATFAQNPESYENKFIWTTGSVVYVQKQPDDKNMYYVVIAPEDSSTSSGYSDGHGTVANIDIDNMRSSNISEGDTISVAGSGMTDAVKVNGKTVNSMIEVDQVTN